jgi:hypothetical protein
VNFFAKSSSEHILNTKILKGLRGTSKNNGVWVVKFLIIDNIAIKNTIFSNRTFVNTQGLLQMGRHSD